MKRTVFAILTSFVLAGPAMAQWASGYNMGTIGVTGGNSASGTINGQCAYAGNGTVEQGDLAIFIKSGAASMIGTTSPGTLTFTAGDSSVALPVADDAGDGFVYDKSAETLADAAALIDLLRTGTSVTIAASGEQIARIRLDGAAAALDGVEACLAP